MAVDDPSIAPPKHIGGVPDRMYILVRGVTPQMARKAAMRAVVLARQRAPKMSGASAGRIHPIYGQGYFGIRWEDSYLWFQDAGIKPFTMRSLAGKTIPMWVDDERGEIRKKNPKSETRTTKSGKTQVLIFRKVAQIGATKQMNKVVNGVKTVRTVPQSYPGAPGRINVREASSPYTTQGKVAGRIAQGNGGVRWRHPGLARRNFLEQAVNEAHQEFRLDAGELVVGSKVA